MTFDKIITIFAFGVILICFNYLIKELLSKHKEKCKQRNLLNHLLTVTHDQFNYCTNLRELALIIQKAKLDFLENPKKEDYQKAFSLFNPPRVNFLVNIKDYAFTTKYNPLITECILRYITALETALAQARAYNDEAAAALNSNISIENAINLAKLHSKDSFAKIILSINMCIYIADKIIKYIFNYSEKFLGKKYHVVPFFEIDHISGFVEYIEEEITIGLNSQDWKKPYTPVDITPEPKLNKLINCIKIIIKILNKKNKNDLTLVDKKSGVHLVSLEDYKHLGLLSILMTKSLHFSLPMGLKIDKTKAGFAINSEENNFKIILGGEFEPSIFRGQNYDYPKFIPTFQREDLINNPVKHCVEYIKREEFKTYFAQTPYYQILSNLKLLDHTFQFDLDAIAQHYGFATNHLDVTKDIQTALFFAYTICINGKYYPISDFEKYHPTLYVSNFAAFIDKKSFLTPVGFQAVSRPLKQSAMAICIDSSNNETKNSFIKIDLPRNPNISYAIYNSFKQGDILFPDEPIKIVENKIRTRKYLNEGIFKEYCKKFNKNESELRTLLSPYYIINTSLLEADTRLYLQMTNEIYDKLIPWIKENIFYRTKIHSKADKIGIAIEPMPLNIKK